MDGAYFRRLWDWLEAGGYAAVASHLAERVIAVDVLGRAPDTTGTADACAASLGPAEQIILDAVESGEPCFGDLISLRLAGDLLDRHRRRLSPQALASALEDLGYTRHPALVGSGGRMRVGAKRDRIYVRGGTFAAAALTVEEVQIHWAKQGGDQIGTQDRPFAAGV
jgi:hypothetical protein